MLFVTSICVCLFICYIACVVFLYLFHDFLTFFLSFSSLPFLDPSLLFLLFVYSSDRLSTDELISPSANNQQSNYNNPVASSSALITDPFAEDEENAISSSNQSSDTVNVLHHV
jgi:hypothetical protein